MLESNFTVRLSHIGSMRFYCGVYKVLGSPTTTLAFVYGSLKVLINWLVFHYDPKLETIGVDGEIDMQC